VGCVGPDFQLALFAAIVAVFAAMGAVFWLIGRRELRRQQDAARALRKAAVADAVALFELAAAADAVALEARRRELASDDVETSALAMRRRT
jgi:hypothetical protein